MAFSRALETMLTEQDHDGVLPGHQRSGYHFKSDTQSSEENAGRLYRDDLGRLPSIGR